jgi:hypothetical protein
LFPLLSGSSCVSVGCCVIHNLLCGPSASTVGYTSLPFLCSPFIVVFSSFTTLLRLCTLVFNTMYVFLNLFSLVCPYLYKNGCTSLFEDDTSSNKFQAHFTRRILWYDGFTNVIS